MVKVLLDKGIQVNAVNRHHRAALSYASEYGHTAIFKLLLDRGGRFTRDRRPRRFRTLICRERDHEDTVELLLDRGADVQPMESNIRESPLCYAAKSNRPRMIMQLLDRGVDINARDSYSCTTLSSAAQIGYYDCVEILLSRGADRNVMCGS